jgi:hypothetical protein
LAGAAPGELLGLAAEIQGRAIMTLTQERAEPPPAPSRFIAPDDAARIAGVGSKRIYDWARNQKWAHRPTRRCLRINEEGFRRWLSAR